MSFCRGGRWMFLTTHFTIHSMPSLTPSLQAQKSLRATGISSVSIKKGRDVEITECGPFKEKKKWKPSNLILYSYRRWWQLSARCSVVTVTVLSFLFHLVQEQTNNASLALSSSNILLPLLLKFSSLWTVQAFCHPSFLVCLTPWGRCKVGLNSLSGQSLGQSHWRQF